MQQFFLISVILKAWIPKECIHSNSSPQPSRIIPAIWHQNSHSAILALLSLCINFKNSFDQMTSGKVLWKTSHILLLKKCLRPCPGPSMYLSERTNCIISSFHHRILKILFVLGSRDDFKCLGCRIGTGYFFWYLDFWKNTVTYSASCAIRCKI